MRRPARQEAVKGSETGAASDSDSGLETVKVASSSTPELWLTTDIDGDALVGSGGGADLQDWLIRPAELVVDTRPDGQPWKLGEGGYGTVHRATLNGHQTVAVKTLLPTCSPDDQDEFLKEIAILRDSQAENLVRFIGMCVLTTEVKLVTEFMENGDLRDALLEDEGRAEFTWSNRCVVSPIRAECGASSPSDASMHAGASAWRRTSAAGSPISTRGGSFT